MAGPNDPGFISLDNLVQNLNQIVQYLGRLTNDLEGGKAQLWQPYNSLLVSIAALSATLTTGNLIQGSGLGTVAALLEGASGTFLKSQGTGSLLAWANVIVNVKFQVLVASGTYTPSTGTVVSLLGALGSGAGGGGVAQSTGNGSAGGGGSGSLSLALKTAAQIGVSQVLTIGGSVGGGTAGANNGTAGVDTSIGALCIGKGGSPGVGAVANGATAGGLGGVAGTGDFTPTGNPGQGGFLSTTITTVSGQGANGGNSIFGGGGLGGTSTGSAGGNATNYGGGGGGARSFNNSASAAGGNSSQGVAFALDFTDV